MIDRQNVLDKLKELTEQKTPNGSFLIRRENLTTIIQAELLIQKLMELEAKYDAKS